MVANLLNKKRIKNKGSNMIRTSTYCSADGRQTNITTAANSDVRLAVLFKLLYMLSHAMNINYPRELVITDNLKI